MKKKEKDEISMKWRMVGIMLMCWFLPFCLIIGAAGYFVLSNQYGNIANRTAGQMAYNNQVCTERLNFAIRSSRKATYDQFLEENWKAYRQEKLGDYMLYYRFNEYIRREYLQNQAFSSVFLWLNDGTEKVKCNSYNTSFGGSYQQVVSYWNEDHDQIKEYLTTLDTKLGFLFTNGRLYMARNLLDNSYQPYAALVMRINLDYCFGPLINLPQAEEILLRLNDNIILLKGDKIFAEAGGVDFDAMTTGFRQKDGDLYVFDQQKEEYFRLGAYVKINKEMIQTPFYGYPVVFGGMVLFLIPLLVILLRVFGKHVSAPVKALMNGAEEIQDGHLGYQIEEKSENLEFKYLTNSFNQMSKQLKYQFDHIYEEELALRDAKIMALQSHINPHFMNNTLEIINWEARLGGNEKVSRMIEALSTLMDAAMDRKKRAEVALCEELIYVNAYLYINSERYGKRLTVVKEIDESILEYEVPRLILQPVIENAIEHGVRPMGHGTVTIRGYAKENFLYLDIINDGTLTKQEEEKIGRLLAPDYDTSKESSGSLGIANVNQRLRILYGQPCGLSIKKLDDTHIVARITIAIR